jgi:hypothetical protein
MRYCAARAALYQLYSDPSTTDQLEDEHDKGDDQQQMDQVATHATEQSQQPEHDEYCNDRPQHCFLLLRIKPYSALAIKARKKLFAFFRALICKLQRPCRARLQSKIVLGIRH